MVNIKHGNFIDPESWDELEQLNVNCPMSKPYFSRSMIYDANDYNKKPSWDVACNCDVLPAGTYYIGDPCYAIGGLDTRDYWINFCNVIHRERKTSPTAKWNRKKITKGRKRRGYGQGWDLMKYNNPNYGIMVTNPEDTSKKPKFYNISIFGTGGDGAYTDVKSKTGEYSVDAGLIGAVPIESIPTELLGKGVSQEDIISWKDEPYTINGGHIFTFEDDVHCYKTDYDDYLIFGSKKMFIGIDIEPGLHEMEAEESYNETMENSGPW